MQFLKCFRGLYHRTSVKGEGVWEGKRDRDRWRRNGDKRGERIKEEKVKEEEGNGGVKEDGQGFGKAGEEGLYQPLRTKIPACGPANKAKKIVKKL